MIQTEKYGVYHATNEGYCSWYEFACEIFRQAGLDVKVNPIKTVDYPTRAKRPMNSRLSKDNLDIQNINRLPEWKVSLDKLVLRMVKEDE